MTPRSLAARTAIGIGLATLLAAPAPAQVRAVDLYAPRPFGHVIGDTIALRVEIALNAPYRLDPASLPAPHPLDYWLELKDVRFTDRGASDGAQRYALELVYQIFYAPLEPKRLEIPALALSAVDGEHRVAVPVPSWSFLMSPLREIVATGGEQAMALRPDIVPRPIATARDIQALLAAAALTPVAFATFAWWMAWWPFNGRRGRPFAAAARTVRAKLERSSAATDASPAYRAALLALHRAFDATAGKGLFAEDLPAFFDAHPAFRAVESEVRNLFAASRQVFFGGAADGSCDLPAAELLALSRRLRAVERIAS